MSIWEDQELLDSLGGGSFFKFETPGDNIQGTVNAIELKRWPDGKLDPQLTINTTQGPTVLTAGQSQLKRKLAGLKPDVGDFIDITYTGEQSLANGKAAKTFEVSVNKASEGAASAPVSDTVTTKEEVPADALAALKAAGVIS